MRIGTMQHALTARQKSKKYSLVLKITSYSPERYWACRACRPLLGYMPMNMPTLEEAFAAVQKLAADFRDNESHYLSPIYQESEVRKDFIDKFLIALGWDVNHDHQKNPFQQEVKVERGVSMAGSQRRTGPTD